MYYQNKEKKMVTIIVTMTFKPKFSGLGKELVKELKKESLKEEGCKSYKVLQDVNDGNTVILIEKFYDNEAVEFHKNTKHVLDILKTKLPPMIEEKVTRFVI